MTDEIAKAVEVATDGKTTQSRPVEPVVVTVIGTGDGSKLPSGTMALTAGAHEPNVVVQVVTPFVAILVRFINNYVGSLAGILAGAMATRIIPAKDFSHLFLACAGLALGGSVLMSLKDVVTVFSGLEKKFPLASGNV